LSRIVAGKQERRSIFRHPGQLAFMTLGLATAWCFFYLLGWLLSRAPASFHEGTIWKDLIS
jgi:hypothetical protein